MIDFATRYSATCWVFSEQQDEIVQNICQM